MTETIEPKGVPILQRVICGVLAILGAIAVLSDAFNGRASERSWGQWILLATAAYGDYIFALIALKGHQIRPLPKP